MHNIINSQVYFCKMDRETPVWATEKFKKKENVMEDKTAKN